MPFAGLELIVLGIAWLYPFVFRAPHVQRRESITVTGPTAVGLLLEALSFVVAFWWRLPADVGAARMGAAAVFGIASAVLSWTAVHHLGRQFRVRAGLYADHKLIRTGPYSVVRHPIYASVLALLLCVMLLVTPWKWMPAALAVFAIGTEIRVRSEDRLLASRFGEEFQEYRRNVRAYVPWVR